MSPRRATPRPFDSFGSTRTLKRKIGLALLVVLNVWGVEVEAQERPACAGTITRTMIVPCALAANLHVRAEQINVAALEGRRIASGVFLPSNPVLILSAGQRSIPTDSATNWYATLSQELEIGGQRASRLRAAEAARVAQEKRWSLSKRDAEALAWSAFFEVLAAREQRRLAETLLAASERMRVVVRARADKGISAALDADLAEIASFRALQSKLAADRTLATSSARLAFLLGHDPATVNVTAEGDLTPLPGFDGPLAAVNPLERAELQLADAERSAARARASAFRRSRVPNPSISAFVQNDGFNERVLGVGIAVPIPLPAPLGRTYAGEIAEAEALAERATVDKTRVEREIRLAIAEAQATYSSHRLAVSAIPAEKVKRAEDRLQELNVEIEAGRLGVRDALVAQQSLIEFLQENITERRALALASVDLAHALGVSHPGGAQ